MNERLTTRDLAELLANQTDLDKKRAEEFIETLSSYFAQSLERNKIVKIFGLGVFKIVLVSERKSVHIQTGEPFIIPAHHKLTFVPDKDFKEQINRPFALFESIEATESEMLALNSQKTVTSDDGDDDDDGDSDDEMTCPKTVAEAGLSADNLLAYGEYQDTADDYWETPVASASQMQNDFFDNETPEQNAFTDDNLYDEDILKSNDARYSIFTSNKKRKVTFLWLFSLMALLCMALGSYIGVYKFLQHNSNKTSQVTQEQSISSSEFMTDNDASMPTDVVSDSDSEQTDMSTTAELPNNGISNQDENRSENNPSDTNATRRQEVKPVTDWIAPSPESTRTGTRRVDGPNREIEERNRTLANTRQPQGGNAARTATNTNTSTVSANAKKLPTSIKMPAGSTLTQLALEYYGDKIFWVYIYEHNKSRIGTDPKGFERVPIGLELLLPAPQTYGIDAKSAASREKARQKQAQLMK